MRTIDPATLKPFARKYIWWKTPDEAAAAGQDVIAQVMNIGDYADVNDLLARVGEDAFRQALKEARAGQFNARSWIYWHHRLGLADVDHTPGLPERKFG